MGGKSQKSTTTQEVKLPPYMEAAYKDLISRAGSIVDTPYDPAMSKSVAGFSAPQTQAFQNVQNIQGIQNPYLSQAQNYAASGASAVSPENISQYLNPFQNQVIDATMSQIGRNNAMQQSQLTGNAAMRGALGGDRVGVAQAELARNQDANTQNILAQLNSQNYSQALGAAQGDKARQFQGASAFGALGNQAQQAGYQDIASLLGIGAQQQGLEQSGLDTASGNAQAQYQHPFSNLSWLAGITGGLGSTAGGTTTGTSTTPGPSPLTQIAGLGLTAMGAFSDERVKDDAKRVGWTDDGLPIYTFRYKGSPQTQMGLMAQDVEKVKPEAVGSVGGIKTVNYDQATADEFKSGGQVAGGSRMDGLLSCVHSAAQGLGAIQKATGGRTEETEASGQPQGFAFGGLFDNVHTLSNPTDFLARTQGMADPSGGIGSIANAMGSGNAAAMTPSQGRSGLFANDALVSAGLGMLGSQSSDPLSAIGEGAMAGMNQHRMDKKRKPNSMRLPFAAGGSPWDDDTDDDYSMFGGQSDDDSGLPFVMPSSVPTSATPATSAGAQPRQPVSAASLIKGFEGYAPVAKWDYRQHSGGYGTKAQPGERFTPEIAERRLNEEIAPIDQWLSSNVKVNMTPEQRAALTSFGYNLGVDDLERLLPDINAGDWGRVGSRMLSFNKAGGETLPGLVERRRKEAALLAGENVDIPQPSLVQTAQAGMGAPSANKTDAGEQTGFFAGLGEKLSNWEPANIPLMAAGLGMLASKSPNFGTGLGEGGLQGLKVLMDQRKARSGAEKLKEAAAMAQQRLGIQQEALKERQRHNQAMEKKGGEAAFSKNVIWGVGPDGNPALLQPGSHGEAVATKIPEGYSVAKDPIKLDAGTDWILLDPQTRQQVGKIPKDIAGEKKAEETGKSQATAAQSLPSVKSTVDNAFRTIEELRTHPGRERGTGMSNWADPRNYFGGTDGYDFFAKNKQAQGQSFMAAREALKGAGQVTDFEGKKGEDAIANLDTAQSEGQYLAALDNLKRMLQASYDDLRKKAGIADTPADANNATADPLGIR